MADYWKSQAKKFCDFCKCWIADNKPSIEFHEKGKRHKENVTQRLKDIGKKSAKEHKAMLHMDEEMKKMEQAALQAYMKDVEANADFTSKLIKEQIAEKRRKAEEDEKQTVEAKLPQNEEKEDSDANENEQESESVKPVKLWHEAESEQGYTYYWHIETGESVWEPPEVGYMSLAEQKEEEEKEQKKKGKEEKKTLKKKAEEERQMKEEERQMKEEEKRREEEERARLEREKMRSRRVIEEKKEEPKVAPVLGPAPRVDPYGGWKTVETRVEKPIDLQLPKQDFIEIKVPAVTEPKMKFKEKTVESLGKDSGGSFSFKKRKGGSNPKRNMRQRLDDD